MSSDATTHDRPHVIPLAAYLGVAAALLVLTVITVLAAQVHLGGFWNIVVALLIASVKATLVAFIFMHLFYDNKLYFLVFTVSIAFLALLIGLSMADTERRGDLYQEVARPIQEQAIIYLDAPNPAAEPGVVPADSLAETPDTNTHSEQSSDE
jgi:cytochrome c oxidase subunit IV